MPTKAYAKLLLALKVVKSHGGIVLQTPTMYWDLLLELCSSEKYFMEIPNQW
jgi:hypothetical protein